MAESHGIIIKKQFGQHFLRNHHIVENMIDAVTLNNQSTVLEIGCGDGFLTSAILQQPINQLVIFEIDPEWAAHVQRILPDKRLIMRRENFLDITREEFQRYAPVTILANLPYQVTFPILHLFQKNKDLISEGVVMVQEEVAQKLVKSGGRDYGYSSLFFQHHFTLKLLTKVAPSSFLPPPKVFSRLVYLKPKESIEIPQENLFWAFVKLCFKQPRRTIRNNMRQSHYDVSTLSEDILNLRAQQLDMANLLKIWDMIRPQSQ